jgi:hypothetical protein
MQIKRAHHAGNADADTHLHVDPIVAKLAA